MLFLIVKCCPTTIVASAFGSAKAIHSFISAQLTHTHTHTHRDSPAPHVTVSVRETLEDDLKAMLRSGVLMCCTSCWSAVLLVWIKLITGA